LLTHALTHYVKLFPEESTVRSQTDKLIDAHGLVAIVEKKI